MKKTRIAIVGLGMAVVPHAKSALDLADRVEVAYAFSPSAERRARFAWNFPFPQCDRLETILGDASIEHPSGNRQALRGGRKARAAGEAARNHHGPRRRNGG
jgi:hypothetical protein